MKKFSSHESALKVAHVFSHQEEAPSTPSQNGVKKGMRIPLFKVPIHLSQEHHWDIKKREEEGLIELMKGQNFPLLVIEHFLAQSQFTSRHVTVFRHLLEIEEAISHQIEQLQEKSFSSFATLTIQNKESVAQISEEINKLDHDKKTRTMGRITTILS